MEKSDQSDESDKSDFAWAGRMEKSDQSDESDESDFAWAGRIENLMTCQLVYSSTRPLSKELLHSSFPPYFI